MRSLRPRPRAVNQGIEKSRKTEEIKTGYYYSKQEHWPAGKDGKERVFMRHNFGDVKIVSNELYAVMDWKEYKEKEKGNRKSVDVGNWEISPGFREGI